MARIGSRDGVVMGQLGPNHWPSVRSDIVTIAFIKIINAKSAIRHTDIFRRVCHLGRMHRGHTVCPGGTAAPHFVQIMKAPATAVPELNNGFEKRREELKFQVLPLGTLRAFVNCQEHDRLPPLIARQYGVKIMARLWVIAKVAAFNWSRHKDARQGAALAYYSVFSIGPVIVIAIAIAGLAFGREAVNGEVSASIKGMLGDTGANAVQAMLADAGRPRQGILATLLGLVALVFAAIGVIIQLKDALNIVWKSGSSPNSLNDLSRASRLGAAMT